MIVEKRSDWLTSWETMQKWCKRAKMPEANDVKNQFLDAISVMSPNFHETWVLRLQDKGDIEFTELLNRYKAHWKITYGKQASQRGISKAVFATWQGHEEVKPNETKQEETPLGDRACPCGRGFKKHQPWKCWEIFEDIRPKNYKPVASARQKWEKAMKANPTWKALVEKERTEMSQSKKPTEQANVTLGGEAFGFFTTPAIPTKISEIPTEKRWVVDTGAQVHVCNDRRLFVTFEDAQSVVKGFQYPKLSPENLILATKKSAQEPRSEGSIHTWHRRLGHVGTERIEKLAEMTEGITIESNPGKKKQMPLCVHTHKEERVSNGRQKIHSTSEKLVKD
ncbi:Polynucleotidyl transferase, ribonuclease H fold [Penicillium digitatum]|uniref:Polynucleotidyl transferase, ribonuclease H fold n=1 Tax=Penicillium digitatum TaxID=36651 RepID=A0A7T7BM93_PENDI|nr:Polynucleotidyl transferase, ribonuclease H fold [Penicillium digitatum]